MVLFQINQMEMPIQRHDILGDKVDVHGNILVVGGGMVGVEASEYICEKAPGCTCYNFGNEKRILVMENLRQT